MEFGDRVAHGNQGEDRISAIQERFYPRKLKEPMTSEQRRCVVTVQRCISLDISPNKSEAWFCVYLLFIYVLL